MASFVDLYWLINLCQKEKEMVELSSISDHHAAQNPFVSSPIYTATKHAIIGLTKAYGVSLRMSQISMKWK